MDDDSDMTGYNATQLDLQGGTYGVATASSFAQVADTALSSTQADLNLQTYGAGAAGSNFSAGINGGLVSSEAQTNPTIVVDGGTNNPLTQAEVGAATASAAGQTSGVPSSSQMQSLIGPFASMLGKALGGAAGTTAQGVTPSQWNGLFPAGTTQKQEVMYACLAFGIIAMLAFGHKGN